MKRKDTARRAKRIRELLAEIGQDKSLVTQIRRLLAQHDMGPRQRMTTYAACRNMDDGLRYRSRF